MTTINIQRTLVLTVFILFTYSMMAQVAKTEYFMKTSYMKTYLNPALRPDQGQLVVPVLPNLGANVQTNTINLDHLTFNKGGERVTFMHPSVSNHEFLKDISSENYVRTDVNYKIFAFGMYKGEQYNTMDIGLRVHADANLPKSVFKLLKVGFDQDAATSYDLKDISATAQSFVEIGFGHSRPLLNKKLMVGARGKLLLGAGYLDLNAKQFDLTAGPNEWRARSQASLRGAAPGVKAKFNKKDQLDGFDFDFNGIPGYGFGVDLGAVYDMQAIAPILSGLKVSASVNDIGFIYWTKENSLELQSSQTEIILDPASMINQDEKSIQQVFEDMLDDLQQAIDLNQVGKPRGRSTSLRATMYLGAEYEILKNKLSAGALYSARFGNYYTSHELTFSGNYQPYYWLGVTGSYSVVHSNFDTFGFALHLAPRKGITFFVASDYVIPHVSTQFLPTSSEGVNIQLGFSIPIGKVGTI